MARTLVTPTALPAGTGVNSGAGTTIDNTLISNGVYVDAQGDISHLLIRVTNTNGSNRVMTIRASAQDAGYVAGYFQFTSGKGDLQITVPASTGDVLITGLEVARHLGIDPTTLLHGALLIDFAASFAGVLRVYSLPKVG